MIFFFKVISNCLSLINQINTKLISVINRNTIKHITLSYIYIARMCKVMIKIYLLPQKNLIALSSPLLIEKCNINYQFVVKKKTLQVTRYSSQPCLWDIMIDLISIFFNTV